MRWAFVLLGMALVTGACSTRPVATPTVHPAFTPGSVQSVAVLPFFEWQLSLDDTHDMTDRVLTALRHTSPDLTLVAPDEASALLIAEGLTYAWALYLDDERAGDTPESTLVMRMADALGADLLAHVRFLEVMQHDGSTTLGPAVSSVIVELRFFDGTTGEVRWQSAAGVEEVRVDEQPASPIDGLARSALVAVLDSLPHLGAR
jgi:hypothetical protein